MNEMYSMSIVIHYYGVLGILSVILINLTMLFKADNIQKYKRQMSLFNPIGLTAIGTVIFTGVVMMASKHLEFSIENIIMIVFSVAIIVLEAKRSKNLKYLNYKVEGALDWYKKQTTYVLISEAVLTISISIWMWQ